MKILTFIVLIALCPAVNFAQLQTEKRIEFNLNNGLSNEKIMEFDDSGFLLRAHTDRPVNGKHEWFFDWFDTSLERVKTFQMSLKKSFEVQQSFATSNSAHTLFCGKRGKYVLLTLDAETLKENVVEGQLAPRTELMEMAVAGDIAYFAARHNSSDFILSINWKTGFQRVIPMQLAGYSSKQVYASSMQLLKETNEVFFYVKARKPGASEMFALSFDADGNRKAIFKLPNDDERQIGNISSSFIGPNKYLFSGTYRAPGYTGATGLFFSEGENELINFITYHKFSDLQYFISAKSKGQAEAIARRKQRRLDSGKPFELSTRIASHPIVKTDSGYLYLGEAYRETNTIVNNTVYINPATVIPIPQIVFDGYRYTHAVLVHFDFNGTILWDQSFEMRPEYKPKKVRRFIAMEENPSDTIRLVFATDSKIISKSFGMDGRVLTDRTIDPIHPLFTSDKITDSYATTSHWYNNYFYTYGFQTVKNQNETRTGDRNRRVYFINKFKYL